MKKYLVRIEFRYSEKTEDEYTSKNKMITIGVYDTFEEACKNGNNLLEVLESKFELHQFPDGRRAPKKRFSEDGCFGSKNTLVTHLAYLKTPFEFYAKIETLKYSPIDEVINNVVSGSVDLTGINNTNSITTIGNTTTDITMMKAGWYSDNFRTYYLDENGVKHYR